jgi:hypothetical protein
VKNHRILSALAVAAAAIAAVTAACVGDDPATTGTPGVDSGGTDGAPSMEGGGTDGGGPTDSSSADSADAAPWTPAQLDQANNLALWLEPSAANFVISNNTIGTWKDLSKNKNDAKNTTTGPTIDPAVVNGHDAVHFTSNSLLLTIDDTASLQFGDQQFYVAAVARLLPTNASGTFFSKVETMIGAGMPAYSAGFEFFAATGVADSGANAVFPTAHIRPMDNQVQWDDPVFDDSKFHLVTARRVTPFKMALTVDDLPAREGATGSFDLSEVGKPVNIGTVRYGTFNPPVDFDIAELVVIHGATAIVADADVANLRAYLKKKYKL